MIDTLIAAWKQIHATYIEGGIKKVMYFYLSGCIVVVAGLYYWLYYMGCVSLGVLLSVLAGAKLDTSQPPITIVGAVGIILIVRYTFLGALDQIAKKPSEKFDERIAQIEDKVRDLHQLAFTEMLSAERKQKIYSELKSSKNGVGKPAKTGKKV